MKHISFTFSFSIPVVSFLICHFVWQHPNTQPRKCQFPFLHSLHFLDFYWASDTHLVFHTCGTKAHSRLLCSTQRTRRRNISLPWSRNFTVNLTLKSTKHCSSWSTHTFKFLNFDLVVLHFSNGLNTLCRLLEWRNSWNKV